MEKERDAKSGATLANEILREPIVGGNQDDNQDQQEAMDIPPIETSTLAGILPTISTNLSSPQTLSGIATATNPASGVGESLRPPSIHEPVPLSAATSQFAQNLPSPSTFYPEFYNGGNNELPSPLTFTGQTPTVGRGERGVFQWPMPGNRTLGPSPLKKAQPTPSEPSGSSEKNDSNNSPLNSPQKRGSAEALEDRKDLTIDTTSSSLKASAKKQKV